MNFTYDISAKSILKYKNRIFVENLGFQQQSIKNDSIFFDAVLKQDRFYFQQNLSFSQKFSEKTLLNIEVYNSYDDLDQELDLSTTEPILISPYFLTDEKTMSSRSIYGASANLMSKTDRIIYELGFLNKYNINDFEIVSEKAIKKGIYASKEFKLDANLSYNLKNRFLFKLNVAPSLLYQELENINLRNKQNKEDWIFDYSFAFQYKVNRESQFLLQVENRKDALSNNYLYFFPVVIDTRTIIENKPDLNLENRLSTSINYSNYNIIEQSNLSFLLSFQKTNHTFIAQYNITENLSYITFFRSPKVINEINASASKGLFIDAINNKINLSANANFNEYYSVLNTEFYQVQPNVYSFNFNMNSAFDGFYNYKTDFSYTLVNSRQENSNTFSNRVLNVELNNIFTLSERTNFRVQSNLMLPQNSEVSKQNIFVDFNLNHIFKNKKLEIFVIAKNIFNNKTYQQVNANEFSESLLIAGVSNRTVVLGLSFQF